MAERTQVTSADSSIKTKPLGRNWTRRLKETVNSIIADLKASEVQAGLGTSVTQIPGGGRSVNTSASGAGAIEVVTGAVNGVPATLRVMTDGSGWTNIVP